MTHIAHHLVVNEGEVRVKRAAKVLDTDRAKVWWVDLHTKYAAVMQASYDEVLLYADALTRNTNDLARGKPTALILGLPQYWVVTAECVLYTCRIVAYWPELQFPDD